ncbi:MAG: PAS domain S-box protein, partial [Dehalococcoidales bacterium]|nr:PAS domain S-box protein [Dehalococcoidales bacterium]
RGRKYTIEDRQLLDTIASQMAMVIENAKLFEDIRESKNALQETEEKYETLVEQGNDGIAIVKDGLIVFGNSGMSNITGMSLQEALGKPFLTLVSPEFRNMFTERFQKRIFEENAYDSCEIDVLNKNSGIVSVEITVKRIQYLGNPALMIVMYDISERKKMVEALRENERKFRELSDLLPQAVFELDLRGNLTFANRHVYEISGYTPDDMNEGMNAFQMIIPKDREPLKQNLRMILSGEKVDGNEYTAIRKDGTTFPILVYNSLIIHEGKPQGFRGVVIDITSRLEAEEREKEMEVLREMDQLRGQFLSNVSHELRTPLASITGFTSTLLRTDTKWSEEQQRDFLETMKQEANRLTKLVNDLLDVSRLDAGGMKLEKKNLNITEVIGSIRERLDGITKEHQLKLEIPTDLPKILGDEMRIGQIVSNLVENATKFAPKGSEITIEAKVADDKVVVTVADHGIGISAKDIKKLFDRFYQSDNVVSGQKKGTGLGLAICKGIIESHDGKIWIESKIGKGSRFSFSLPVSKCETVDV